MAQQAAILCILIFISIPIAFSGRALLEAPAAAFLQPPPLEAPAPPAAAVFLQPPPPAPPAGPVASAIPQPQPADADHHPAAATSYHIHFTKIGLLGVLVSFLAGCFLCALFIVFIARSATTTRAPAANGPDGQEAGGGGDDPAAMENAALRCLCCVARVAAFL